MYYLADAYVVNIHGPTFSSYIDREVREENSDTDCKGALSRISPSKKNARKKRIK